MSWHERLTLPVLGPRVKGFGPPTRRIPEGDEIAVDAWVGTKQLHRKENAQDSGLPNAVEKDTYPAWICALYSTLSITWPRAPTSLSHSPSMPAPSINLCILPLELGLGCIKWHSPTTTVDTKVKGRPPPTGWMYVWLPTPMDIFAGSERAKLRIEPVPEKVTAWKRSLDATTSAHQISA